MLNQSKLQRPDDVLRPSAHEAMPASPPGPRGLGPIQGPPRWRSTDLLGSAQEVEIEHGQAVYRLKVTSLGKLILTK